MQSVTELLNHYGYIVLFVALMLELIAFPLPGELLMTYCGYLVNQQKLNWILSIAIAASGTITGITISYFLGRVLGITFFHKYGHYIHLGPEKIEKTSTWFNKYGNGLLIVAYFIPGVRHVTGYFSGITKTSYKKFSRYAYLGALLWCTTFISLGKILGNDWEKYHSEASRFLVVAGIVLSILIILILIYKNYKQQILDFTFRMLGKVMKTYHSFGKIKIAVAGVALSLFGFLVLIAIVIQDFLGNEFGQFDTIVTILIKAFVTNKWESFMIFFGFLSNISVIIPVVILMILWIMVKGIDKSLEIRFVLFTFIIGEVLDKVLCYIFRRPGPGGIYTFPSINSFMAVTIYGFFAFLLLRHAKNTIIRITSIIGSVLLCFLAGLSPLYYQTQFPSDIYAGYIFGGAWLTLTIILLEVYRIIPKLENTEQDPE